MNISICRPDEYDDLADIFIEMETYYNQTLCLSRRDMSVYLRDKIFAADSGTEVHKVVCDGVIAAFSCVSVDMAYVIGQSVANGRRAGILSATGVALGSCTHAVASAIGLTALITASPLMFTIIKYAGATYLVYLGVRMLVDTLRVKNENSETSMHNKAKS
ncbi:TPA: LysE family translocator, partial [Enterobacter ludwigii]